MKKTKLIFALILTLALCLSQVALAADNEPNISVDKQTGIVTITGTAQPNSDFNILIEGSDKIAFMDAISLGEDGSYYPNKIKLPVNEEFTCTILVAGNTYTSTISTKSGGNQGGSGEDEENPTVTFSIEKETINMPNVFGPEEVEFTEGESTWDIMKKLMDDNDISYEYEFTEQYNSVYVQSIDGDGEFDHGSGSGWMYSVNGIYPNVGASLTFPEDGDEIRWRYTTNLGKDIGGGHVINPDNPSGGGGGGGSSSNDDEGLSLSYTLTDKTKAEILFNEKALDELDFNENNDTLEISVEIVDNTVLSSENQSLLEDHPAFKVAVKLNDKEITDFGEGELTINLPYKPATWEKASSLLIYAIDSNNKAIKTKDSCYDEKEAMVFTTSKLDKYYGIVYNETVITAPINKTEEPNKDVLTTPNNELPFIDVKSTNWAYDSIKYLYDKKIINGKSDTNFAPEDNVTRGEFITMLANMSKDSLPEAGNIFNDVSSNDYYAKPITWAFYNKITSGTSKNTFSPNDLISRQDMSVMIKQYADYKNITLSKIEDTITFADQDKISSYALEAVKVMQEAGIINGYTDNTFRPQNFANRAEAATMLTIVDKLAK